MMLKLVGAAVAVAVAALIVRQVKPELAMFVQLGGVLLVTLLLMDVLRDLLGAAETIMGGAPGMEAGGGSFTMIIKALGICVTTQLGADICRDSGSGALANVVELGGRLLVLGLALPLLKSIAELAMGLIRG